MSEEKVYRTIATGPNEPDINEELMVEDIESIYNTDGIDISNLKAEKIKQAKAEAARRIDAVYPQYKQINNGAAVIEILNKENYAVKQGTTYTLTDEDHRTLIKAKACRDFINLIRSKSNELETLINSKRTLNTLSAINVSDDIYWS